MPAFLVHGWMPDAYRAAPLPVLVLLSGVLSKVGAYGFLRVVLPLFPDASIHFQEVVLIIALASILYGSVMAFTQTNLRLIAGYSSVAQLGFITLGVFSLSADGGDGSVIQMFNHGLVVAADVLRDRGALRAHRDRGPARDGRDGEAGADLRGAVHHRHDGDAGDPRIGQLRRRVLHPQRRLLLEGRDRADRLDRASRWPRSTRCACTSGRCTTACPTGSSRARSPCARPSCSCRWSLCILAIALYPGLITTRGEASVDRSLTSLEPPVVAETSSSGARRSGPAGTPPEPPKAVPDGTSPVPPGEVSHDRLRPGDLQRPRHRLRRVLPGASRSPPGRSSSCSPA